MRPAVLLLMAALPLSAEFLRIDVAFEDIGCASCIESLQGRLARVRGVARAEIDAKCGVAALHLAARNRVRLRPLLSRITQDGTKVAQIDVIARGTIEAAERGLLFHPSGLAQTYLLELKGKTMKGELHPNVICKVKGIVLGADGAKPILRAASVTIEAASAE